MISLRREPETIKTVNPDFESLYRLVKNNHIALEKGTKGLAMIASWEGECYYPAPIVKESLRLIGRLSLIPYDIRDHFDIMSAAQSHQRHKNGNGKGDCKEIARELKNANQKNTRREFLVAIIGLKRKFEEHIKVSDPHHL